MPFDPSENTIILGSNVFKVQPGDYSDNELPYFAVQRREGQPSFQSYVPETATFWESWHRGYGRLYLDDIKEDYYTANGVDASVLRQLTLAPYFGLTAQAAAPVGEPITQWIQYKQKQYAVGSTNVYVWNPAASPNGWAVSKNFPAGEWAGHATVYAIDPTGSTAALPCAQYLIVPTASTQWFYNGATWTGVPTACVHVQAIRNEMWKVWFDGTGTWQVAKTADGVSYPNPNSISTKAQSGAATINNIVAYDNRLYLLGTGGIQTLDSSGTVYDAVNEMTSYADPKFGRGIGIFLGQLYLPAHTGLLQFTGSTLLNPLTTHSLESIGPDLNSWSQSDVRGQFVGIAPDTNYLYGTLNSDAGNGFVMKYRDFGGLQPGQGWHPLMEFAGQQMGACAVSTLDWYGTGPYSILWVSAGQAIYQTRLPQTNDNALLDSACLFQPTGSLDLPIIDDAMPTLSKMWIRYMVDLACPTNTNIQMLASLDGGAFVTVGGPIAATTGVLEFDFSSVGVASSKLQPRIQLTASVNGSYATTSPYVRSIVLHHLIRPVQRQDWQMGLVAEDNTYAGDNSSARDKLLALKAARNTLAPTYFQDLLGDDHIVTVNTFGYKQVDRKQGQGVGWLAKVELEDFAVQTYYSQSAFTMISLTS